MNALLTLLTAAALAHRPDRAPYLTDASTSSVKICWRKDDVDACRVQAREGQLPGPGQGLRFAATGDCGEATLEQGEVAKTLQRRDPELVLLLGDIVYPTGKDKHYDTKFFPYYADLMARRPFFPAVGNHDYGNTRFLDKGNRRFDAGYGRVFQRPRYYSFDAGPVHFISIDTNQAFGIPAAARIGPDSRQLRWIEEDLAASKARWKVAYMHVPLFTLLRKSDTALLRGVLEPIFRRHGVDLVLAGHDHVYERVRSPDGYWHLIVGTCGAPLEKAKRLPSWMEKRIVAFGFLLVEADERRLKVEFIGQDNAVLDAFEVLK